jgi:ribosome-associated translation inhibitor RaiA
MEIHFKGIGYELISPEVTERATRKLVALKKYLRRGEATTHVFVDLSKESGAHQSGDIWAATINLTAAATGQRYNARAVESTIENALDRAIEDMAKEIRRDKKKNETLLRRGGNLMKSWMQGFEKRSA